MISATKSCIQKIVCVATIGALPLLLSFAVIAHSSPQANAQDCIPIPGSTTGAEACEGSLTYPLAQIFDAGSIFASLLKLLVGIAVTAAFFYFFWNLVKYIRDEEGKDEAKTKMGFSLGAIFVIVTLWGIIGFVRGVLGVGTGEDQVSTILLPDVGTTRCSGNNVYIKYQTKQGRQTTNEVGERGFCAPKEKLKSSCCLGVEPPNNTGFTLCNDAKKCHIDENCEKAGVGVFKDYDCGF